MKTDIKSNYTGSLKTFESVKQQIFDRLGAKAAEEYNAYTNCLTYREWKKNGYIVNRGEKSFRSVVMVEKKDKKGKVIKKYAKPIFLFFHSQVSKIV